MSPLARWPDLSFRYKGLIVVAFPALATIAIAFASHIIGARWDDAESEESRTYQAVQEIQSLQFQTSEANSRLHSFWLTGNPDHARQARTALNTLIARFDDVRPLVDATVTEARHLDELTLLARGRLFRLAALQSPPAVPAPRDFRTALEADDLDQKQMMTLIEDLRRVGGVSLQARLRRSEGLRTGLRLAILGIGIVGVAGGWLLWSLFAYGITNRLAALQTNVQRLAAGVTLRDMPAGNDEIGVLSKGMSRAADILRRRTAALDNASLGIAEADASGRCQSWNASFATLAGFRDPASHPPIEDAIHQDGRDQLREAIRATNETGRAEVELRLARAPAGYVAVTLVRVPGEESGFFVFLRDVTRRHEAETALILARDQAVAANRAKSGFLARISHDIRTPLGAILGAIDLLSESHLTAEQSGYVSMFRRNCCRLVALINDFLDFAQIEAGVIRIERVPFRPRETVNEVRTTFLQPASNKGIALDVDIGDDVPEWVLGDPIRIQQVLVNLLSNALKFTEHGSVEVSVMRIDGDSGEMLYYGVRDTGPGIAAEDQKRIFSAFARSQTLEMARSKVAHPVGGCGLGLTICRELVELMGGRMSVTSRLNAGTTFYFTLPLARAPVRPQCEVTIAQPPLPPAHKASVIRVLVADDCPDGRLLISHYLRKDPVDLQFAENGRDALDRIERGDTFDVIFMDVDMPVLDGLSATHAIHSWQRHHGIPRTPIVGFTAHAMQDAVHACLDAGCVAHLAKPVDRDKLWEAIQRYSQPLPSPEHCSLDASDPAVALVPKYLATKHHQVEEAMRSLAAHDFDPIHRFGHNLKGTAGGYGFPDIEVIGSRLEQAALDRNEAAILAQLQALQRVLDAQSPVSAAH